ncbi:flavodoxin domain-containing protein [Thermococcus sp. LS2]|uniref:flavodoxin domain-containing protein n=1 Tax=Thermococcus sp. LS2 TaxID=1638260 RepID=UPI00143B408B|nr:flavodoxin domain-containing protein [Thermococcus sp. LS2]NJE13152.1 hypothetical protein [Thermococcus sp. LS2]
MRVYIIYDTKRGSTEMIVKWMSDAIKDEADVRLMRVFEVDSLEECDFIIVRSPIYYERPLIFIMYSRPRTYNNAVDFVCIYY